MHDHELTRMVLYESRLLPDRYEPFIEIYTEVFETAQQRALITQRLPAETLAQAYTALTRRLFMARLYTRQLSVEATSREIAELVYPQGAQGLPLQEVSPGPAPALTTGVHAPTTLPPLCGRGPQPVP